MYINNKGLAYVCKGNVKLAKLIYERSKALSSRSTDLDYRLAADDILKGIGYIEALLDSGPYAIDALKLLKARREAVDRLQSVRFSHRHALSLKQANEY